MEYSRTRKAVRAAAAERQRDPSTIRFFSTIMPIIGRTVEEAVAKFEACKMLIRVQAGLAKSISYCNVDVA